MKLNPSSFDLSSNATVEALYRALEQSDLNLDNAELFCDFPLYKGHDEKLIISQLILVSEQYGIVTFHSSAATSYNPNTLIDDDQALSKVAGNIFSRLVRNDSLRKGFANICIPFNTILFVPSLDKNVLDGIDTENNAYISNRELIFNIQSFFSGIIDENLVMEAISTIQGAKGLIKPESRNVDSFPPDSKVSKVCRAESSILLFDKEQQDGYIPALSGPQRIRGLAGSGKTVVLAMKAAITLLRDKENKVTILYTFSTKSLYQHVKRLIQRFYREFDDDSSHLDRISVMHSWGGRTNVGVYYKACTVFEHPPMTLSVANRMKPYDMDAFDFVCKDLLENVDITPLYDFVFVDEAQDYNKYFLRLCTKLARNKQVTFGADVFQNIFQKSVPTADEIYEDGTKFVSERYLDVCYRTPLAVLISAHAVGLGVYGSNQVQKIEKVEHWKSLGYNVTTRDEGLFEPSEYVEVIRENKNSPTLSEEEPSELITYGQYNNMSMELDAVAAKIHHDIEVEGLSADDVLVMCADDYRCTSYFNELTFKLNSLGIQTNNIHAEKYNIKDFKVKGRVTLSTIHKAKGNEAYSVYLIGTDFLCFALGVKNRNLLFTAMTRTKGWLFLSGVGTYVRNIYSEIDKALENSPYIRFYYPSGEEAKQIDHDIQIAVSTTARDLLDAESLIEKFGSIERLQQIIDEKKARKGKK